MPQDLFTVLENECMACGAPESVAPDLMEQHGASQEPWSCRFLRQPETAAEYKQAIAAVNASCCGAVVYTGSDPAVLSAITDFPWHRQSDFVFESEFVGDRAEFGNLGVAKRILSAVSLIMLAWFFVSSVTVEHLTTAKMWGGLAILYVAVSLFSFTRRM